MTYIEIQDKLNILIGQKLTNEQWRYMSADKNHIVINSKSVEVYE